MRTTQIDSLISRIKTKDPVLYEILRNLNLDSRDTGQSSVTIQQTQEQQSTDLSALEAAISALQSAISTLASQADLNALAILVNNHKDRHVSGGGDSFSSVDLLDALVKRIRSVTADLTVGTIDDGNLLRRDGSSIVGVPKTHWEPVTNGDPDFPEILFDDDGDVVMEEVED